ncbi:DUF397 domain-containing protein [Sphaerisporangium sp. NPDC051017]|uniref:DUF397 domain-containing protein n=1 Tax=Sphaerisporangium sp. NPDC051017 TaxID=3154636 RepID=UPI00341B7A8F
MDLSGAEWRRSTLSQGGGNNCVEVAQNLPRIVAVRDSKATDGSRLIFTQLEWSDFIIAIKNGGFDQ